jgi:hypothetical protein
MTDFPEQVEVPVTQEDIDRGQRNDPFTCPLARGARRAFTEVLGAAPDNLSVGSYVGVALHGDFTFYDGPAEWHAFMNAVDKWWTVEPATFTLRKIGRPHE